MGMYGGVSFGPLTIYGDTSSTDLFLCCIIRASELIAALFRIREVFKSHFPKIHVLISPEAVSSASPKYISMDKQRFEPTSPES